MRRRPVRSSGPPSRSILSFAVSSGHSALRSCAVAQGSDEPAKATVKSPIQPHHGGGEALNAGGQPSPAFNGIEHLLGVPRHSPSAGRTTLRSLQRDRLPERRSHHRRRCPKTPLPGRPAPPPSRTRENPEPPDTPPPLPGPALPRPPQNAKNPARTARPLGPPPAATTRQRNRAGPRGLGARPRKRPELRR